MSDTTAVPAAQTPGPARAQNRLGLGLDTYKGAESTLCNGCGHDAITASLVKTLWEMGVEPHTIAKMSGIGCSSKTTAYFVSNSWGFNAVHGRMPSVATGALLANRTLRSVGVSGDGDTASIGLGQFAHLIRRNVPIMYVIENNGVYGLTKGQFSATADRGSKSKWGLENEMEPIDCCGLAIELGCGFVARSFAADKKQLEQVLRAALSFRGTALVDVISPCVTFNNHPGSTKSYDWGREHAQHIHEVGFVAPWEQPTPEIPEGEATRIPMPNGGTIVLRKVDGSFDATDALAAARLLRQSREKGEFLTGIFHVNNGEPAFDEQLRLVDEPLATLPESRIRPGKDVLESLMKGLE
jgi:2-oxoglutarate ferredoxin oxidoreductase subunit beta